MVQSEDDLVMIKSAAELLGISEVTLRRWDQSGKLRAYRHPVNGYRLYRRGDVEALAGESSHEAIPPPPLAAGVASFIGRAGALSEVEQAFTRGARLVTVVGPPGVGKTRLAMRHAELLAAPPPGGAWFCDATGVRHEQALRAALVGLFGLVAAAASTEVLVAALARRRPLLLVLDNAEDLDADARKALSTLCTRVPPLHLLVTSREPLGVDGEALIELPPLELPATGASGEAILASEAVALMLARARSAPALARHPDELAALVRALDGLPLAIELAAPHVGVLAPAEVLARFGPLLDVAPPGALRSRHESLRAAIDASWQMLDDASRSALAQCSLFASGFTLDAAEQVVAGPPGTTPLTLLRGLRDRSLITIRPGAEPGEERLFLLESIRVFAHERLDPPLRAAAGERHARYYLTRAEAWAGAVRSRGDVTARRRLMQEQVNLQAAFARALAQARAGDPAAAVDALRLALCLDAPLSQQGRFAELLALLDAAEPLATAAPEPLQIQASLVRGEALGWTGLLALSLEVLERAVTRAAAHGDAALEGEGRAFLAFRLHQASRLEEAISAGEHSLRLHAGGRSRRTEGSTRIMLGIARGNLGQNEAARADTEAGRRIAAELGDRWSEGIALAKLAHLDQEAGRFEEARFYYEACLRCLREAGDVVFEALCQCYFATLAHEEALAGIEGAADEARRAYEGGLMLLDAVRLPYFEGLFRGFFGALEASFGATERALEAFDRASVRLDHVGQPAYLAALDLLRGALDRRRAAPGDPELARSLAARIQRTEPFVARSMHVRTALRMLAGPRDRSPASATAGAWTVGPEARWFAAPGDPTVSLGRRGAARRILMALVTRRLVMPGAAMTADALIEVGWPGEKVMYEAGLRRARMAIVELRSLGLRDLLRTRDDGYLLDPGVPLTLAERDKP